MSSEDRMKFSSSHVEMTEPLELVQILHYFNKKQQVREVEADE